MAETNLVTLEKVLKEEYLPLINNLAGVEPSPLLSKIKKEKLDSDKIVSAAPIGLIGNFGMSAEGNDTPGSGSRLWERFDARAKDMYSNIEISEKALRLTGEKGAMANALKDTVKACYEEIKFHTGRQLFGDGTGKLCTYAALSSGGNTVTVSDTMYLKEGMTVDFHKASDNSIDKAKRRIIAIDYATKAVTFDGDATTLAAGYMTVQNSYNRELTGLGAVFNNSVTHIYGLAKASNPILKPISESAGNDITDDKIRKILTTAKRQRGSNIDMILCGDNAFSAYSRYLDEKRDTPRTLDLEGGFKAISFFMDNREIAVVSEQFVPTNSMWCVDTSEMVLKQTEWDYVDQSTGGIFTLVPGKSVYRALMANYGELIIKRPGSCVEITNCNDN